MFGIWAGSLSAVGVNDGVEASTGNTDTEFELWFGLMG